MTTRDRVRMPAVLSVGARGFEPLTSSASRKRSPPELSARGFGCYRSLRGRDLHRVQCGANVFSRLKRSGLPLGALGCLGVHLAEEHGPTNAPQPWRAP